MILKDWLNTQLCNLPDAMRQRVEQGGFSIPWDELSPSQRRSVALQLDYRWESASEQEQKPWGDFFERVDSLKRQITEWGAVATQTAGDLALKETRVAELKQELARMDAQKRLARGDYFPERRPSPSKDRVPLAEPGLSTHYLAYPKAMNRLAARLGATPDELVAWICLGPADGGIAAYLSANELDRPPRFFYATGSDSQDYTAPLMACWFKVEDIDLFEPADRYITGAALIDRWGNRPGLNVAAFIQAKIAESRLLDFHPIYGGTRGTFAAHSDWPPLETGLFPWAQVVQIEAEDFEAALKTTRLEKPKVVKLVAQPGQAVLGSPEWRTQIATKAANTRHDHPGGSREKQQKMRELWASGKYTTRDLCAEQECAALDMSISVARRALTNTPDPSRC